jgi:hypothetical protein
VAEFDLINTCTTINPLTISIKYTTPTATHSSEAPTSASVDDSHLYTPSACTQVIHESEHETKQVTGTEEVALSIYHEQSLRWTHEFASRAKLEEARHQCKEKLNTLVDTNNANDLLRVSTTQKRLSELESMHMPSHHEMKRLMNE